MVERERVRRALLFSPGDDLKKIAKGAALPVDAAIMDLEDGVALSRKVEARRIVVRALTSGEIDFGRAERLVRLNASASGLQAEDLAVIFEGRPDGYVVPKVESAEEIQHLSAALTDRERQAGATPGTAVLIAIIETARGVINLREIAAADERLVALVFGAEDLAGSIGAVRTPAGHEVSYARSAVVIHAAAFGLQAIDTPYVTLGDLDGLRAESNMAMQMGYTGKLAIHPAQVEPIMRIFTPTPEAVEGALRLLAAYEAYQADGTGVFAFEGKMVDRPMIRSAERILARAGATRSG